MQSAEAIVRVDENKKSQIRERLRVYARNKSVNENDTFLGTVERTCALFNVRRAARAVTEIYEAALSPSGVHATQFALLVAIQNYEPVPMSALAHGIGTDRTTLTRTLKPLQENGWVTIVSGKDRRTQEVRLTDAGRDALATAVPFWERAQTQVREHLGTQSWKQLLAHLHTAADLKP